jgi:hypothetical protein
MMTKRPEWEQEKCELKTTRWGNKAELLLTENIVFIQTRHAIASLWQQTVMFDLTPGRPTRTMVFSEGQLTVLYYFDQMFTIFRFSSTEVADTFSSEL